MKPGKEYNYRLATLTENIQTMIFDTTITNKINQSVIYILALKPVELDADSSLEVTCIFKSVKVDADANGEKFSYQSGVTTDSAEIERFGEYVTLINNPFNLRINKTGEIIDVFKTDKILSSFIELRGAGESITPEQRKMVQEQIIEGGIKPLLMQIFRKIPEYVVAKDSVWRYRMPESQLAIFRMNSQNKFSVSGLENFKNDKIAVLDASLEAQISGESKLTDQGITYEFEKPVSEASGKIYFNVTEGHIKKSRIKNRMVISYTMEGSTPQGKQQGSRTEIMEYTNIVELL
jgi:hypothetical protein